MITKRYIALLSALILTACSSKYNDLDHYLKNRSLAQPTATSFQTCRNYGCQIIDDITLNESEWKKIDSAFKTSANNADEEREQITRAIASFETIVGKHNGTSEDIWGTFQKTGRTQQDCVDESTNTSIYMLVLKQRGHIKFHSIESPRSRVPIISPVTWPHQTAVIKEIKTSQLYVVDSWFYNNGAPPNIATFEKWKAGWSPRKEEQKRAEQAEKTKQTPDQEKTEHE